MADQQHLDIFKQGVETWNLWREKNIDIKPDLSGANLRGIKLFGIDLSEAILTDADLSESQLRAIDLIRADLEGTQLKRTKIEGANLCSVNLKNADLTASSLLGANFSFVGSTRKGFTLSLECADLKGANFNKAELLYTNFSDTILDDTNLSYTTLAYVTFTNTDLSKVKGLETVIHRRPSFIGIDTIYASRGEIPEVFLKGTGVPDSFITYARALVGKPIEYHSCFISYSGKDGAFARRLYADLQSNNVRCWFAPEDLKWGARIRTGIDEAIHLHDKLLLILSKHSVASGWVEREVKTAIAREKKEKRTILFPVRVDRAIFDSPFDWATEIRHERNIGDFTRWKDHDEYQKAFSRLLRDLKA
jgi:TIR domain/Pentapeptide repeats (8 copies)/Pentapeptide repeats (9 copies)